MSKGSEKAQQLYKTNNCKDQTSWQFNFISKSNVLPYQIDYKVIGTLSKKIEK